MLSVGHFKQGFSVGLTILLRRIFPAVAAVVMLWLSMFIYDTSVKDAYVALLIITALLCFIVFPAQKESEFFVKATLWHKAVSTILSWLVLFSILLFLGYVTKSSAIFSRRVLITWFLATPVVILTGRMLLSAVVYRMMISEKSSRRAVIVGVNPIALSLARRINDTPDFGVEVEGYFEDRSPERLDVSEDVTIIGKIADLPKYIQTKTVDIIFLAVPIKNVQRVTELLDQLHDTTASIYFVPDIFVFDLIQCRTVDIKGIPAVALCETPFFGYRGVIKRLSDIMLATLALIVFSPIILITTVLIKLTSPGSVIFKQRRYGLDGREIMVYKFRSMHVSDDGAKVQQAEKNDNRLTPIGGFLRRYSIDELPQFVNVLQGRMSVVGPRPHAVAHNEEFRKLIKGYMVRHKVTPGITGLAQVSGFRGETETVEKMQRRIELDLEYLRRWSLALDIRIVLRTIGSVFSDKAAY